MKNGLKNEEKTFGLHQFGEKCVSLQINKCEYRDPTPLLYSLKYRVLTSRIYKI